MAVARKARARGSRKSRIVSSVWRRSFLALSTVLGVPVAESEGALALGLDAEARAVALALRSADKKQRALALARPLATLARAVDAMRLS